MSMVPTNPEKKLSFCQDWVNLKSACWIEVGWLCRVAHLKSYLCIGKATHTTFFHKLSTVKVNF